MALISGWIFILLLQNLPGSGVKPPVVNPYLHPSSMGLWSSSRHWGGVGIVATQFFECSVKQKVCVKSGTLRIRLQETTFSLRKRIMEVLYTEVLLRAGFVFRLLDLSNKEQHGPSPLPPPEEWFCLSQRLASKAISSTSVLQTLGIP